MSSQKFKIQTNNSQSNRNQQVQFNKKELFSFLRKGIENMGFQNIKEKIENDKYLIMIAIGDQSDMCEAKWANFPILCEAKEGMLELKLLIAINSKIATYDEDAFVFTNEFLHKANQNCEIGSFV